MSASQATALRELAAPIAARHDCDLEDVRIRQAGKRRLVRVVVDHAEGALTLDLVAAISRDLSRALDESSVLGNSAYVLEVTSPGVDRPLREPRHWQRAMGRIVRVTRHSGDPVEGRLSRVSDAEAVLDVDGTLTVVALRDVARAVVQVEFSRVEEADLEQGADADPSDRTPQEG